MSDRHPTYMSGQWLLAGALLVGALVLALVMGLNLVGFAVMVLLALPAAIFLRRSESR